MLLTLGSQQYLCKQCRSRWDGSKRAFSSRSTLFASLLLILTETLVCNKGRVRIQRWNIPYQKHSVKGLNNKEKKIQRENLNQTFIYACPQHVSGIREHEETVLEIYGAAETQSNSLIRTSTAY